MAPTEEMLSTVDRLKVQLGIPAENTASDEALDRLIREVTAHIAAELDRPKLFDDDVAIVETHDGGMPAIFPRVTPISSVIGVTVDGGDWTSACTNDAFRVATKDGTRFPDGTLRVRVTYKGGWSTTQGAARMLERACLSQAAFVWKRRPDIHLTSESSGGQVTRSFADEALTKEAAEQLRLLRRVVPT